MRSFVVSLLVLAFVVYGECQCGANLQECGSACYDPSQYYCFNSTLLCPTGWDICVGTCYNPATYDCVFIGIVPTGNEGPIYQLCPAGYEGCQGQCYDPQVYTCFNQIEGPLCVSGDENCNGQCYSPNQYVCIVTEEIYLGTLCPAGNQLCNGSCFPASEKCLANTTPQACCTTDCDLGPCPFGTSCCITEASGGATVGLCYDTSVATCASCPFFNAALISSRVCPLDTPYCCGGFAPYDTYHCTAQQC